MFKKLFGILLSVGSFAVGASAFAAADSDVLTAASTTITTLKDNILGVITANIGLIAICAAALVAILVVYRLLRRMVGR